MSASSIPLLRKGQHAMLHAGDVYYVKEWSEFCNPADARHWYWNERRSSWSKKKMWVGSCVYAWVTVAIRFLYKHCMLVLSIQCVGSLCNWIFSSTGCGVLLCSLLGLCIWISLLSNMLDLCVYAWVTKQHTYIIHI